MSMKPTNEVVAKNRASDLEEVGCGGSALRFPHVRLFPLGASLNISYSMAASPPRPGLRSGLRTPLSLHNKRIRI